jgi:hypothetical protein
MNTNNYLEKLRLEDDLLYYKRRKSETEYFMKEYRGPVDAPQMDSFREILADINKKTEDINKKLATIMAEL